MRRKLFDFNRDGKASGFEKGIVAASLANVLHAAQEELAQEDEYEYDDEPKDCSWMTDEEKEQELIAAGLDVDELRNMDQIDREFELEAAGFDIFDFIEFFEEDYDF